MEAEVKSVATRIDGQQQFEKIVARAKYTMPNGERNACKILNNTALEDIGLEGLDVILYRRSCNNERCAPAIAKHLYLVHGEQSRWHIDGRTAM